MGGLDLDLGLRRRTAYSRVGFRSPFVWQSIRSYDDISSIGVIHIALPHGPKTVTSKTLVRAGTDLSISRALSLRSLVALGSLAAFVCCKVLVANE
jgi:hypothetical protein